MTVKELIEELQTYPQDMKVYVQDVYGKNEYLDHIDHLNIISGDLIIGVL